MVYYAYAKNTDDECTWRYLIVAANIEALNEWNETISSKYSRHIFSRSSEDFFAFSRKKFDLAASTAVNQVAHNLVDRIFFTLLHDRDARVIPTFVNVSVNSISQNGDVSKPQQPVIAPYRPK